MALKVTAVFDIGKTNKKFFLFDENYKEVDSEFIRFDEIPDDDGFLSEDLEALTRWITRVYDRITRDPKYILESLNFSTYGASMVHLGKNNGVVTPFYNYLKPFPEALEKKFIEDHGGKENFELRTASPFMGMLNSGLQLYYIKYAKPDLFKKIRKSVHFPQYLSGLITGKFVSDYTSLGSHTGLWDYEKNTYAQWVKDEQLEDLLCPVVSTKTLSTKNQIKIGVGIHDSSSALIPYLQANEEPFALISTGTWSICMNVFNQRSLTIDELNADCLNYMGIDGMSVKASRLFLGKHLSNVARQLSDHFNVEYQCYKSVSWPQNFVSKREDRQSLIFDHSILKPERYGFTNNGRPDFSIFDNYEDAVYNLFDELTDLQIASLKLSIGDSGIKKIYVDGGISSSEVFLNFLSAKLPQYEIYSSSFSLGSALGAAIVVNDRKLPDDFLERVYHVKLHSPVM